MSNVLRVPENSSYRLLQCENKPSFSLNVLFSSIRLGFDRSFHPWSNESLKCTLDLRRVAFQVWSVGKLQMALRNEEECMFPGHRSLKCAHMGRVSMKYSSGFSALPQQHLASCHARFPRCVSARQPTPWTVQFGRLSKSNPHSFSVLLLLANCSPQIKLSATFARMIRASCEW